MIFVTHDIDEAMTMGDRVAIFRQGGRLAQYDSPDAILARPADEFVAAFVGDDRALRRLALRSVADVALEPRDAASRATDGPMPQVASDTTVRTAVSLMIEAGADAVVVVDGDGRELGLLRLDAAHGLLRA